MFWSKLCKSNWNCAWNLAFPVFISPVIWNICENLHYESVYFKEILNEQEYYQPTIYGAGVAVVSTITSLPTNHIKHCEINNSWTQFSHRKTTSISLRTTADLACSKRSDSGERCEVKKAMKSRGGLETPLLLPRVYFFALLFTSHRSPPSERLEQATADSRIERNR